MFNFIYERFYNGIHQWVFEVKGNAIHIIAELYQLGKIAKYNIELTPGLKSIQVSILNSRRYVFIPGEDYHLHLVQTGIRGIDKNGILDINMMFHWERYADNGYCQPYVANWYRHEEPILNDLLPDVDKESFVTDESWNELFGTNIIVPSRISSEDYYGDTVFNNLLVDAFYTDRNGKTRKSDDILNSENTHIRRYGYLEKNPDSDSEYDGYGYDSDYDSDGYDSDYF
jgi:hypothetical protein